MNWYTDINGIFIQPPNLQLPTKIEAVVGDTIQLYYNAMTDAPNWESYNWRVTYSVRTDARPYPRYTQITPTAVGDETLTIEIVDYTNNVIASGSCAVVVRDSVQQPATPVYSWNIGDSLTDTGGGQGGGEWATEQFRRLTGTGGTPAGDGYGNITFHEEANSGKDWIWYVQNPDSPFVYSGVLDFEQYRIDNALDVPTVAQILLTWNGMGNIRDDDAWDAWSVFVYTFIDGLKTAFPSIDIKLMSPQVPSVNGGLGFDYGGGGQFLNDIIFMKRNALRQALIYDTISNQVGYEHVEHIQVGLQHDSLYNMPQILRDVNTRNSSRQEYIGTNGVHPSQEGQFQIGDAMYRNFIVNYCQ
jgi:hypothetical protein